MKHTNPKIKYLYAQLTVLALALCFLGALPALAQPPAQIQAALDAAYAKYQNLQEGANADYIPALAKVDSNIYGIALVTVDGQIYTKGDLNSRSRFSRSRKCSRWQRRSKIWAWTGIRIIWASMPPARFQFDCGG